MRKCGPIDEMYPLFYNKQYIKKGTKNGKSLT